MRLSPRTAARGRAPGELLVGGAEEGLQDLGPGQLEALDASGRNRPEIAAAAREVVLEENGVRVEELAPQGVGGGAFGGGLRMPEADLGVDFAQAVEQLGD